MADLTQAFSDLPIIHIGGMTAATVDGAAFIDMRPSPRDWEVVEIKLNTWVPGARKSHFVTLKPDDLWFFEIANAIVNDLALGHAIETGLAAYYAPPSAYDKARSQREAA